jgi:hypothetical protein
LGTSQVEEKQDCKGTKGLLKHILDDMDSGFLLWQI